MDRLFWINSILLGVGLAMDAFSVSLTNGLQEPKMCIRRICMIAGTYAAFQAAMPMIGWVCVHSVVLYFTAFQKIIPFIALILLLYIGGKMLLEGIRRKTDAPGETAVLSGKILLLQGVATSIDALSVGFTIAEYDACRALVCALTIAAVTFCICCSGVLLGRKIGDCLSGKAGILGGLILIGIGIEIFVTGI